MELGWLDYAACCSIFYSKDISMSSVRIKSMLNHVSGIPSLQYYLVTLTQY